MALARRAPVNSDFTYFSTNTHPSYATLAYSGGEELKGERYRSALAARGSYRCFPKPHEVKPELLASKLLVHSAYYTVN
ncbi:hypothetical protein BN14_12042 [Rhizoctonia solani AG-1 IB]|uniref:Uncharacterized protein n=1 Tax=Thanatephorus cucumeris (strain AG1-IB / isolate 7/3/14) TaxID=1108050 RepID=M5CHH6_THACB|nr:hypothetical protein BN14_12042 [Rhizoctonia solani AG-1 IB]